MQEQHIKGSLIIFANLIGKYIKAYIDDMVVKSEQADQHILDLEKVFSTLRKYQIKLNPSYVHSE